MLANLWILMECASDLLDFRLSSSSPHVIGNANIPVYLRVVLLNYREDGVTPFVIIWKDALTEMKV
jgi:hypothetical protein